MCTYRCVKCGGTWTVDEAGSVNNSHGLCPMCAKERLIPVFRKQQQKEGNPDCFGKSSGYCDQENCTFHPLCTSTNPQPVHIVQLNERLKSREAKLLPAYY
jgi:hypothetical protein